MRMTSTLLVTVGLLVFASLGPAPAGAAEAHCDRAKRYETLSAPDQQTLQNAAPVLEVNTHTGSAYHMGYVYQLLPVPPELVMAVFTAYEDQPGVILPILWPDFRSITCPQEAAIPRCQGHKQCRACKIS